MKKFSNWWSLIGLILGLAQIPVYSQPSGASAEPSSSKHQHSAANLAGQGRLSNHNSATSELIALLTNIRTMSANFSQTTQNSSGKISGERLVGKMALHRPGNFRWEVQLPYTQLWILTTDDFWIYDQDLAQLIRRPINHLDPESPAILLSNSPTQLAANFQIKRTPTRTGLRQFTLTPRQPTDNYRWISLIFNQAQLTQMVIADHLKQETQIQFSQIQLNRHLNPANFTVQPPPGTEIIDERHNKGNFNTKSRVTKQQPGKP